MNPADHQSVFRILDAAANRCREGLRVVEEYVRFGCNDAELTEQLKSLRHALQQPLGVLRLDERISARDTPGDVGTQISIASERTRLTIGDVLTANCKRVQESLRVLEEYSKLVDGAVGGQFESLRYQFYGIEQRIVLGVGHPRTQRLRLASLYLLINAASCRQSFESTVRDAIAGGIDVIQLRDKTLCDRELLAQARQLRDWTAETDTLFIMNDRPDLAVLADADGVHVGQEELTVADVCEIVPSEMLVGVSTHSLLQARQAVADGADYLGVGPVFNSQTKTFGEHVGLELLTQVSEAIERPWFAIGGINPDNAAQVAAVGTRRIAVSHAICQSADPAQAAQKLQTIMNFAGTNSEKSSS